MSVIPIKMFSQKTCVVQAYFDATPLQVCTGDSILFDNRTGGYIDDTLAFNWDYDGGASDDSISGINPTGCFFNGVPPLTPCQTFYKQFNTVGNYSVQLFVYKLNTNSGLYIPADTFSRTITVVDSTAWGFINTLTNFECNTPFWVTDSSFNLLPTQNFMGGVTSIYWTLYDYNLGVSNTYYSQIGDTLNIQTFGTNGLIDLPIGQYWLKMETQSYCNSSIDDSINFFITSGIPDITGTQVMCLGDTAMFVGENGCPDFWQWNFGDGSTFTGNDTAYHQYSQVGTYQVSLQTNNGGDTGYFTIEVEQAQTPKIIGYQNNCDSVVIYSIENFDTNYTYTWSTELYDATNNQYSTGNFIINGNTNVETANTASINWKSSSFPVLPNYAVITVEATLKGSNCSSISTLNVYACCEGDMGTNGLNWHDITIASTQSIQGIFISINGTVTLIDSLLINTISGNGGIWFGPYAKIVLDTGGYFEMNNGALKGACEYMWDGVYANGINNAIIIRKSDIEDANNGIVSNNGAQLLLDSVRLLNNVVSVQLLNHKRPAYSLPPPPFTPAMVSITNCTFNDQFSSNVNLLKYPYHQKQSTIGINVVSMEDIQIGSIVLGGNSFFKLQTGIKVYNSKIGIYNNYFKLIDNYINSPNYDAAAISINAPAMNDMENIGDVTIGNLNSYQNTFDSCYQSVYSNNSNVKIMKNIFKYGHQSVRIDNFKNGSLVSYNRFKDAEFGVRVQSLLGVPKQLDIALNYFEAQTDNTYSSISREAINVMNCNSQPNSTLRTKVNNNTVYWAGPRNYTTGAIRVLNSNGILVSSNHLVRQTAGIAPINNDWQNVLGIRVATCQGAQIVDNYVFGFGQSVTTYGNLTGTQFSCNELNMYKYGFYWSAFTSLSDQGILNVRNTHNEWASHPAITNNEKLAQGNSANNIINTDTIKWYYFSSFGNQWIPNDVFNSSLDLKIETLIYNSATHLCAGGSGSGTPGGGGTGTGGGSSMNSVLYLYDNLEDPELRDWLFEDILQGQEYVDLQNEYRAYDAEFLYNMLKEDTTMMFLGGDNDADYQAFFDSIKETELGKFEQVYRLIQDGSFEEAQIMNESLVPGLDIFINLKTVLAIYLDSWCKERYELTTTEYQTLYEIADQTPYAAGDAVYTARIMIGFEPDEHEVAYRVNKSNSTTDNEQVKLYPNPASESVTIEFENVDYKQVNAELNVYSITGKLIESYHFQTSNSYKVLSTERLQNGIYLYHIRLDNGISKSGKLVILKQ